MLEKDQSDTDDEDIRRLERRVKRAVAARKQAEALLEKKSLELFEANQNLKSQADQLETALKHEKELSELQRAFVAMVSHEFRTPLSIIDFSAQRCARRAGSISEDKLKELSAKICRAVKRMTSLMDSILTAARIEAGKITIHPEPCSIKNTLQECCALQQDVSPRHNIIMNWDTLPDEIIADEQALNQIFSNLLSNAVKYSPDAEDVMVRGWLKEDTIFVSVQDFGLGMDEEDLPKLFNRFFRASTSTGISGTGIGLNLVRILINEHHGDITAESAKGKGSTFTISLPLRLPPTEQAATD